MAAVHPTANPPPYPLSLLAAADLADLQYLESSDLNSENASLLSPPTLSPFPTSRTALGRNDGTPPTADSIDEIPSRPHVVAQVPEPFSPPNPFSYTCMTPEERKQLIECFFIIKYPRTDFKLRRRSCRPDIHYMTGLVPTSPKNRPLSFGFAEAEIPTVLSESASYAWEFMHIDRVAIEFKFDRERSETLASPYSKHTCVCKHTRWPFTNREFLCRWLYVTLPSGEVLISQKSVPEHPAYPLKPGRIRCDFCAAILLKQSDRGTTIIRYAAHFNLRGWIGWISSYHDPRQHLPMTLPLDMLVYFETQNKFLGIAGNAAMLVAEASANDSEVSEHFNQLAEVPQGTEYYTGLQSATESERSISFRDLSLGIKRSISSLVGRRENEWAGSTISNDSAAPVSFAMWMILRLRRSTDSSAFNRMAESMLLKSRATFFSALFGEKPDRRRSRRASSSSEFERECRLYIMSEVTKDRQLNLVDRGLVMALLYWVGLVESTVKTQSMNTNSNVTLSVLSFFVFVAPWFVLRKKQRRMKNLEIFFDNTEIKRFEIKLFFFRLWAELSSLCFLIIGAYSFAKFDNSINDVGLQSASRGRWLDFYYSPCTVIFAHLFEATLAIDVCDYFHFSVHASFVLGRLAILLGALWIIALTRSSDLRFLAVYSVAAVVFSLFLLDCAAVNLELLRERFRILWNGHSEKYKYEMRVQQHSVGLTDAQRKAILDVKAQIKECEDRGYASKIKHLDYGSITFEKKIGSGKFGIVFLGRYKTVDVAVKQIIPESESRSTVMEFVAEIFILASLKHPNIVEFIGAILESPDASQLCMVTEYAARGSLKKVLRQNQSILSWPRQKRSFLLDVASAMVYLHGRARPLLHRDLKTDNCVVTEHWVVKVSDFGYSRVRQGGRGDAAPDVGDRSIDMDLSSKIGTPIFMAPEVISGDTRYTEKIDTFSFGMLMADVALGGYVNKVIADELTYRIENKIDAQLHGNNRAEHVMHLVSEGWRVTLPEHLNNEIPFIVNLIRRCLSQDPSERPSFAQIKSLLKKWDGSIPTAMNADVITNQAPYDEPEIKFIKRIRDQSYSSVREADSHLSKWYPIEFKEDAQTNMSMRVELIEGNKNALIGECWHHANVPSHRVLQSLWDWCAPERVKIVKSEKSYVDRGFMPVNDHHQIVWTVFHSLAPFNFIASGIRVCKMRVIWRETAPRCYILVSENMEGNIDSKYNHAKRVQFRGIYEIWSKPDGSSDIRYCCRVVPPASLPLFMLKFFMRSNLRHVIAVCSDLQKIHQGLGKSLYRSVTFGEDVFSESLGFPGVDDNSRSFARIRKSSERQISTAMDVEGVARSRLGNLRVVKGLAEDVNSSLSKNEDTFSSLLRELRNDDFQEPGRNEQGVLWNHDDEKKPTTSDKDPDAGAAEVFGITADGGSAEREAGDSVVRSSTTLTGESALDSDTPWVAMQKNRKRR